MVSEAPPCALKAGIVAKELDHLAMAWPRVRAESLHVPPRNRMQPSPGTPQQCSCARGNRIHIRSAGQKCAGKRAEENRLGSSAGQWNAPTSLTLRERICALRSEFSRGETVRDSFPLG